MPLQLTFHHLAAVVAVADAGTFEGAGKLLGIAQSAVSKHVMDLEARYPFPLFDRSLRGARLTDGGIAVVEKARRLLKQRTALIDSFVAHSAIRRKVRVGITELTAQTWLPSFLHATKCRFPTVELEIEISSMASLLREKLIRADLEMVMFSDSVDLTGLQHWPLGELTSAWYCHRDFDLPVQMIGVTCLNKYPLIIQDHGSPAGRLIQNWLTLNEVSVEQSLRSNSFAAIGSLTAAGLGIGCMPVAIGRELVALGLVREVLTTPPPPQMYYVTAIRSENASSFYAVIADIARTACNYDVRYQEYDPKNFGAAM